MIYEEKLISKNFKNYDKIFQNYRNFKSKKDNLSFEIYPGLETDQNQNLSIDEKFLLDESMDLIRSNFKKSEIVHNEKDFWQRGSNKENVFDDDFMEKDDSFNKKFF